MPDILSDIRHAVRRWRSSPAFVAVAVLTLGVGVGVNVVVISLVEALVLRPLPAVREADRILTTRHNPVSYQAFTLLAARQRVFEQMAVWQELAVSVSVDGGAEAVGGLVVSCGYFGVLGVLPQRGRLFTTADETAADRPAVVVSDRYWRTRFAGAEDVIGRLVTINRAAATIVGVLPPGFAGTELGTPAEVFLPVAAFDAVRGATGRGAWLADPGREWLRVIGRLRRGTAPAVARAETDTLMSDVVQEIPSFKGTSLDLVPVVDVAFPGDAREGAHRMLTVLLVVGACVLLVACANVANLLLAQGEQRRAEMAIRSALGADRTRLLTQLLTETLLLVAVAAVAAVVFAVGALGLLSSVRFTAVEPVTLAGSLDFRVACGAVLVALASAVACGLVPAWHAVRMDVALQFSRATTANSSSRSSVLRDALVAVQVAASVLLVVGAVLFVTTLLRQEGLSPGFAPEGVAFVRVSVRPAGYSPKAGAEFYRRIQQRIAALPGVVCVSCALNEPLGATAYVRTVGVPGEPGEHRVMTTVVAPGYFRVLGIPIIDGADFDERSPAGGVIVNQTLARQLWPDRRALGQPIESRDRGVRISRVIGVVRDSKYQALNEGSTAFLYSQAAEDYDPRQVLFARAPGDAHRLLPALSRAVRSVDPLVPLLAATTLGDHVETTLAQPRAAASLLTILAGLAAALAAIGLHAVLSLVATTGRRGVAIRMALGCRTSHVIASVVSRSGFAVMAGLGAGLCGAVLLGRLAASLLYGVTPTDPWVLILATALTLATATVAAVEPVVRALRATPVSALRE